MFEWDEKKATANLAKHGVAFDAINAFDFETAIESEDRRFPYGETRSHSIGWLGDRLHSVTFTRRGDNVRIISLRRASKAERDRYAKEKA